MVASGGLSTTLRWSGSTTKLDGDEPNEHISCAALTTCMGMLRLPSLAVKPPTIPPRHRGAIGPITGSMIGLDRNWGRLCQRLDGGPFAYLAGESAGSSHKGPQCTADTVLPATLCR